MADQILTEDQITTDAAFIEDDAALVNLILGAMNGPMVSATPMTLDDLAKWSA